MARLFPGQKPTERENLNQKTESIHEVWADWRGKPAQPPACPLPKRKGKTPGDERGDFQQNFSLTVPKPFLDLYIFISFVTKAYLESDQTALSLYPNVPGVKLIPQQPREQQNFPHLEHLWTCRLWQVSTLGSILAVKPTFHWSSNPAARQGSPFQLGVLSRGETGAGRSVYQ